MTQRIAIIGAAHRFPGTTSADDFWQALKNGQDLVTSVAPDRWGQDAFLHPNKKQPGTSYTFAAGSLGDVSGFDASFFGISPREATQMDPQQRLLLEMTWEAMEDAGIPPETLRGSQCGVFMGVASLDYSYRMADDMAAIGTSTATGNTSSIASNRISYAFDLQGPSLSLDTACSSSLVAFHQACQAIRTGDIHLAIAGGISLHLHPYGFIIFSKASMLSPTGRCHVFDADGDGYVRSEGGGVFLLKDYAKAIADGDRILAVVAATGVNTDGNKSGLTVPSADAQAALMTQTLARAGLTPDDIDYLEAHGTGTAVGDPIETRAIGAAIAQKRSHPLPIGSVKSNLGHLETASGVAGLAKALYAIQHREVPATIGIKTLNPHIEVDTWNLDIVTQAQPLKAEGTLNIGINSFGFGGANAHVILQSPAQATRHDSTEAPTHPVPLRLSARSDDALRHVARTLSARLGTSGVSLYDLAYSLYHRREHHREGALLFADDLRQAARQLERFANGETTEQVTLGQRVPDAQGPAFVYTGNGCQWETMGRALLGTSPTFAAAVDEVDSLFQRHADFSLRAELEGRNGEGRLARTEIAQPALFAVQVGLTLMLREQGIMPTHVTGHSVGEVAAAWASGAMTLSDAVEVIYFRSAYQGLTRGRGEMTAVGLGAEEISVWLEDPRYRTIALAGINSPHGITLAGDASVLSSLEQALEERRIFAKRLALDYAFHSPAMDPIRHGVVDKLSSLSTRTGNIPFISTVTGTQLSGEHLGATYWWDNIRQPVQFQSAIDALVQDGVNVFIEIGAHPILRRYLSDIFKAHDVQGLAIASLSREQDAAHNMRQCVAQVLLSGVPIAQERHFPVVGNFVALPHYPWQRERYWYQPTGDSQGLMARHYEHPLLGYRLAQQELTWESQLDAQRLPWLGDHVVGDGIIFPGAGYAEIALAAAHAWKTQPLIDLEALEIHSPLLLDAPHGKRVRLDINASDGALRIRSREPASNDSWSLNASARLLEQSCGLTLLRPAPELPPREPDFTREQHLALAQRIGLEYGPAFQAIGHGWVDGDSVIGVVDLPDAIRKTQADCLLHPGILDSAFQLFIPLLADELLQDTGLAFVPVRLGRLQLKLDAGEPALIRVRLVSRAPHSLCADVELFAADGQAVAVVEEARFKAVRLKQSERKRLSYLDHRLVAAPRHAMPLPLDGSALQQTAETLAAGYRHITESRYANEIEPLLDAMVMAFVREALAAHADAAHVVTAPGLTMGNSQVGARWDALLSLAQDNGIVHQQANGWQLQQSNDAIDAATIWNLLIRDYPDYAALTHHVGRCGYRLPSLLGAVNDPATAGQTTPAVSTTPAQALLHQAIGEQGWHALAEGVGEQLDALLNILSNGQRLSVLEASATQPRLGARLLSRLDGDRSDYRFLGLSDSALAAGEALRDRYPGMALVSLEDQISTVPGAQLVFVTLDASLKDTRTLLERLPGYLAPDAPVVLLGLAPSSWQQLLGLTQDDSQSASCNSATALMLLESLGYRSPAMLPLEDSDNGAYLLWAQAPQTAAQVNDSEPANWLIVSGDPERHLADAVVAGLQARGQHVSHYSDDAATPHVLLAQANPAMVIDLRGLGNSALIRRCSLAMHWLQALESSHSDAGLWLLTHGVAGTLGGQATPNVANDAALWGFGRSLHNEAGQRAVRLLDLPAPHELPTVVLEALLDELCQPDAETEIVLDGAGQRWAPRLSILAAPEQRQASGIKHQALTLGFELPGQLRHLRWQPHALPALGETQVEVRVKATGLNFRDVMYALGLLSDEAIENGFAGPTLGLEFAGEVVSVGSAVTQFVTGDAVVGFGPASFSDRLIADSHALSKIPEGIGYAAAATIPTTFFTVYYALKHLARVLPGERLLIHGAAGGVGLAAIQIGRWLGAELYATVGSEEKRDFLRLLGVDRLYDSRSLTFAEEILHDTPDGRGVDVVLNSLAGEAINQNLRVLNPFGRFLELGKRDFYENTQVGLRPFRNNLSYFGIDSDQLMSELPALTQRLFTEMMGLFADGTLTPLPYTAFASDRVVEAFRYMQQARQIGKVVVTYDTPPRAETLAGAPRQLTLDANASYLVTGGLGGFGLATAEWLASKGARHLILLSRRGSSSEEAQQGIARLEAQGVQVHAAACDVTHRASLNDLLATCREQLPPLKGVVHAATIIDDGLIRNLDDDRIARALAPKVDGARHLDALTREDTLDFFVLYSSATTLFGNPGQASYVAANHWLEALASTRRAQGLPATCVRWGAIEDVGFLARHTQTRDALQERLGGHALRSGDALAVLEQMLLGDTPSLGVLELDWNALTRFLPSAEAPRYVEIARTAEVNEEQEGDADFRQLFASLAPEARYDALLTLLRKELAKILLIEEDKIDPQRSVYDMGFDSLMGVELITALEARLGVQIPVMVLSEASTLARFGEYLMGKLQAQDDGSDSADPEAVQLAALIAQHGSDTPQTATPDVESAT